MDESEIPTVISPTSPLRAILSEIHEVYEELIYVGFPDHASSAIVAHLIENVVHSRNDDGFDVEFVDEDDEDLDDDDDFTGAG